METSAGGLHSAHMPRPTLGNLNERPLQPTKLRAWRKHRRYTLEQAADLIGIDHSTLSKIERQKNPYTQNILEAAAEAYNCTVAELLASEPEGPSELDMAGLIRQASPDVRDMIEGFLRTPTRRKR